MFISVGYKNYVAINRVVSVMVPNSAPIKRMVAEARDSGLLVDVTLGHPTRSVLVTDSEHVILTAVSPDKLIGRVKNDKN